MIVFIMSPVIAPSRQAAFKAKGGEFAIPAEAGIQIFI